MPNQEKPEEFLCDDSLLQGMGLHHVKVATLSPDAQCTGSGARASGDLLMLVCFGAGGKMLLTALIFA